MSKLRPGRYLIYNIVDSDRGQTLALTHKEGSSSAVVAPLGSAGAHQIWEVKDLGDVGQTINFAGTPESGIQANWVEKENFISVSVRPLYHYIWIILDDLNAGGRFTITDAGSKDNSWFLKEVVDDHLVDMGPVPKDPEYLNKYWIFQEIIGEHHIPRAPL